MGDINKLYDNIKQLAGGKIEVGTVEQFTKALGNQDTAKKVYGNLSTVLTKDQIGSENDFLSFVQPSGVLRAPKQNFGIVPSIKMDQPEETTIPKTETVQPDYIQKEAPLQIKDLKQNDSLNPNALGGLEKEIEGMYQNNIGTKIGDEHILPIGGGYKNTSGKANVDVQLNRPKTELPETSLYNNTPQLKVLKLKQPDEELKDELQKAHQIYETSNGKDLFGDEINDIIDKQSKGESYNIAGYKEDKAEAPKIGMFSTYVGSLIPKFFSGAYGTIGNTAGFARDFFPMLAQSIGLDVKTPSATDFQRDMGILSKRLNEISEINGDKSIKELHKEGDYLGIAAKVGKDIVGIAPAIIASGSMGGVGFFAANASEEKYDSLRLDNIKDQNKSLNAVATGVISGVTMKLALEGMPLLLPYAGKLVTKYGTDEATKLISKSVYGGIATALKHSQSYVLPAAMAVQGMADTYANNVIDYVSGVSNNNNFTQGVQEAGWSGLATGIGFGAKGVLSHKSAVKEAKKNFDTSESKLISVLVEKGLTDGEVADAISLLRFSRNSQEKQWIITKLNNEITKPDYKSKDFSKTEEELIETSDLLNSYVKSFDTYKSISYKFDKNNEVDRILAQQYLSDNTAPTAEQSNYNANQSKLEAQNPIQSEKIKAEQQLVDLSNKTTGTIQTVKLKDGSEIQIANGTPIFKEDGTFDAEKTGIITHNPKDENGNPVLNEDGTPKILVVDPNSIMSLVSETPVQEAQAEAGSQIDQAVISNQIDNFYPKDVEDYEVDGTPWRISVNPETNSLTKQELEINGDITYEVNDPINITDEEYSKLSGKPIPNQEGEVAPVISGDMTENAPIQPTAEVQEAPAYPTDKNGNVDFKSMTDEQIFNHTKETKGEEAAHSLIGRQITRLQGQIQDNTRATNKHNEETNKLLAKAKTMQDELAIQAKQDAKEVSLKEEYTTLNSKLGELQSLLPKVEAPATVEAPKVVNTRPEILQLRREQEQAQANVGTSETLTPNLASSVIEAKKADIEKRRKEELKEVDTVFLERNVHAIDDFINNPNSVYSTEMGINQGSATIGIIKNMAPIKGTYVVLNKEEWKEYRLIEAKHNAHIINGIEYSNKKKELFKRVFKRGLSENKTVMTRSELKDFSSINAKYDAELAALETANVGTSETLTPNLATLSEVLQPNMDTSNEVQETPVIEESSVAKPKETQFQKRAKELGEYIDMKDYILRIIAGGQKIKWKGGLESEFRGSNAERLQRRNYIDETNGLTPTELAHQIWNDYGENGNNGEIPGVYNMSDGEILDEVHEVLRTVKSNSDALSQAEERRTIGAYDPTPEETQIIDAFDDEMFAAVLGITNFTPEQLTTLNDFINGWSEYIQYEQNNSNPGTTPTSESNSPESNASSAEGSRTEEVTPRNAESVFVQKLKDKFPNGLKLYHRTSKENWDKIQVDGFIKASDDVNAGVYTVLEDKTIDRIGGVDNVLLQINVPVSEYEGLYPEEGTYYEDPENVGWDGDYTSLMFKNYMDEHPDLIGGDIIYSGDVPISMIKVETPKEQKGIKESSSISAEGSIDSKITGQEPNLNPTDGQKESGNYKLAHITISGMNISVENPVGSLREGKDEDGKAWSHEMKSHYGYFKGTVGRDGDHIDVFTKSNTPEDYNGKVFVIDQVYSNGPKSGLFDESKVMLGYDTAKEAEQAYMENYDKDWNGLSDMTEVSVDDFKKWLYDGAKQAKPFADYKKTPEAIEKVKKQMPLSDSDRQNLLRNTKFIETGETRIDNDYDVEDSEYEQRKVYVPIFVNKWDYAENTDPDIEKFDTIDEALKDLNIKGDMSEVNAYYTPTKETSVELKEVWLDRDNNEVEESDKNIGFDDWAYDNKENPFVNAFGTEGSIDTNTFDGREDTAKKLENEVYFDLNKSIIKEYDGLKIKSNQSGKYRNILVENSEGNEIGSIQIRIANHSYNPKNNDNNAQSGNFISIEIANKNETKGRFNGKYGIQFDGESTLNDVIESVNERIVEIIDGWDIKQTKIDEQKDTKENSSVLSPIKNGSIVTFKGKQYAINGITSDGKFVDLYEGDNMIHEDIPVEGVSNLETLQQSDKTKLSETNNEQLDNQKIAKTENVESLPKSEPSVNTSEQKSAKLLDTLTGGEYSKSKGKEQVKFQTIREENKRIDEQYFNAIERSDMDTAQRIVDQQAANNGYISKDEYKLSHRAPSVDTTPSAEKMDIGGDFSLTEIANGYSSQPLDYFSPQGAHWYGYDYLSGRQSQSAINSAIRAIKSGGNPTVTIYRAVEKSLKEGSVRNGDWITLSEQYAKEHGQQHIDGSYKIISQEVPTSNVWWDGNDINEWGYDDGKSYTHKNTKNNKKLADAIVRDDNGDIIPPSKRFNQRVYDPRFHTGSTMKQSTPEEVSQLTERLLSTGLAKEVKMVTSEEMTAVLEGNEQLHAVYHGSPHSFDQFSLAHIGTGEGAQAFGYGLYFTDKKAIAEGYAKNLGNKNLSLEYKGSRVEQGTPLYMAFEILNEVKGRTIKQAIKRVEELKEYVDEENVEMLKKWNDAIEFLRWSNKSDFKQVPSKNLYSVELHEGKQPGQYDYLRWEKPVSTEVKEKIFKQLRDENVRLHDMGSIKKFWDGESSDFESGDNMYGLLSNLLGSQKEASEFLLRAGIDGIQYPANHTTGKANETDFNYVVFDPSAITIKEKVQFMRKPDGTIYGFVKNGVVYLNSEKPNLNTPIHEFGHLFIPIIKSEHPEFYQKGVELIKESPYYDQVKNDPNYSNLDEDGIIDEATNQAVGDKGEKVVEKGLFERLKEWTKGVWERIGAKFGIKNLTSEQIQDLTLNDWTDIVNSELLSGNKLTSKLDIKKTPTIDVDGIQRPTTNSLGKPIHSTEEGIRNFWKWFGDSKVVDNEGRPLVVYHGTKKDATFNVFNQAGYSKSTFFTNDYEVAKRQYTKTNSGNEVYSAYSQIGNPLIVNAEGREYFKIPIDLLPKEFSVDNNRDVVGTEDIAKWAKSNGYDGVIFNDIIDGGTNTSNVYAIFSPTQIKSATWNNGSFSENNANFVEEKQIAYDNEQEAIQKTIDFVSSERPTRIPLDNSRGYAEIHKRSVIEGFKESGYVDFIGRKINSIDDVVDMWNIHRSPYIEKSHIIFVKEGSIVGTTATTLNKVGITAFGKVEDIETLYNKFGADGMYLLHNHPSGNHKPSSGDIQTTQKIKDLLPEVNLIGHIVIDHDKYSYIDPTKDGYKEFEQKNAPAKLFYERESVPENNPQKRLFEISKALLNGEGLKGAIIYLSPKLDINAYDVFPEGATQETIAELTKQGLKSNLGQVAIITHDGTFDKDWKVPANVVDVIDTKTGYSTYFENEKSDVITSNDVLKLWEPTRSIMIKPEKPKEPIHIQGETNSDRIRKQRDYYNALQEWNRENYDFMPDGSMGNRWKDQIIRALQDKERYPKLFQNEIMKLMGWNENTIPDKYDYYKQQEHLASKTGIEIEKYGKEFYDPFMLAVAKILEQGTAINKGVNLTMVSDYQQVAHGIERNDWFQFVNNNPEYQDISGSEVILEQNGYPKTKEGAEQLVRDFESKFTPESIAELWEKTGLATKARLDILLDGQLISAGVHDGLLRRWKRYVPLVNFDQLATADDFFNEYGGKQLAKVIPLKKVEGRITKAESHFKHILAMGEQAVSKKNKNLLNLTLNNIVNDIPSASPYIFKDKVYYKRSDASSEWEETTDKPSKELFDAGNAKETKGLSFAIFKPYQAQKHQVEVFVGGVKKIISFTDPRVATGINGTSATSNMIHAAMNYSLGSFSIYDKKFNIQPLKNWASFNRYIKSTYTSYNPDFVIKNSVRDFMHASYIISVDHPEMLGGFTRYYSAVKSITDINEGLSNRGSFGALTRHLFFKPDMNIQADVYLKEFIDNGAATGIGRLKDLEGYEKDFKKRFEEAKQLLKQGKKKEYQNFIDRWIVGSPKEILTFIERLNEVSEVNTRLAVYAGARDAGYSPLKAGSMAKNFSVNFGKSGELTPLLNLVMLFPNPAIQSTKLFFDVAKKHRVRTILSLASLAALSFIAAAIARAMSGEDEEGNSYYDMIPEETRRNNVIAFFGFGADDYLMIPISQYLRVYTGIGVSIEEVRNGTAKWTDKIKEFPLTFADDVSPISLGLGFHKKESGDWYIGGIIPQAIKPYYEAYFSGTSGENAFSMPVSGATEYNDGVPEYRRDLKNGAKPFKIASKWLNDISGGDEVIPGVININPDKIEHVVKSNTGGTGMSFLNAYKTASYIYNHNFGDKTEELKPNNIPISRVFYGKASDGMTNGFYSREYWDLKTEHDKLKSQIREYRKLGEDTKADKIEKSIEYQGSMYIDQIDKDLKEERHTIKNSDSQPEIDEAKKNVNLLNREGVRLASNSEGTFRDEMAKYEATVKKVEEYKAKRVLGGEKDAELEKLSGKFHPVTRKIKSIPTLINLLEKDTKKNPSNREKNEAQIITLIKKL